MAEVEPLAPPPILPEEEVQSEDSGPVDAHAETDGEHEATDVVEASSEPEPAESGAEDKPAENGLDGLEEEKDAPAPAEDVPKENEKETTSPPVSPAKKITAKSSISVKPSKTASSPPTPLVKKVRATSVPLAQGVCVLTTAVGTALRRSSTRAHLGLAP